jgi:adenosylmethionine-8-amino-7-oxononanoate aminotransferase
MTSFYNETHTAIVECAQKLAQITPAGLDHFLFTAGGSEANEIALQMARRYWWRQRRTKFRFISLYNSYHGASFATRTASGIKALTSGLSPVLPGVNHIPSYYCYRCYFNLEYPGCGIQCAQYLERTIEAEGSVAAFIAEPMIGAGGMIPPPPEYWPMVRKICTEHHVLLICDEVMTGFCRTGKMFATEHWGIVPDIMTISKGIVGAYLPFGAVAVSNTFFEGLQGDVIAGFSSSGNPICAAATSAAIDVYLNEKIAEHVTEVGAYARNRLDAEFAPLPYVGEIRGLGLMFGIELVADKKTRAMLANPMGTQMKLIRQLHENGIMLRLPLNPSVTNFTPPLIITREEMDRTLDILYSVFSSLKPD